jgi:hypothetical protein
MSGNRRSSVEAASTLVVNPSNFKVFSCLLSRMRSSQHLEVIEVVDNMEDHHYIPDDR